MARFQIEEYAPAGAIVLDLITNDVSDFTRIFKHIDDDYVLKFGNALSDLDLIVSRYARDKETSALTSNLYKKSKDIRHTLQIFKAYMRFAGLETKMAVTAGNYFSRRNIEAGIQAANELIAYAGKNHNKLAPFMSDNFIASLKTELKDTAALNDAQNKRLLSRKEFTAKNRKYYDAIDSYITEICHLGKIVYKHQPLKRDRYNLTKIKAQLKASRGAKDK